MNPESETTPRWRGRAMTGKPVASAAAHAGEDRYSDTEALNLPEDGADIQQAISAPRELAQAVRRIETNQSEESPTPRARQTASQRGGVRESRAPRSAESRSANTAPVDSAHAESTDQQLHEKARAIVLRQLAASSKSRHQLEEKLTAREIPKEIAGQVLDRFEAVDLVDDRAFAAMFVRSRAESRKLSRAALRRELQQRGITGDLADEALSQRSDEDELHDARSLVKKKLPASVDPTDRQERDKLTRRLVSMLGRKGYAPGLAFSVVRDELDALKDSHVSNSTAPW